MENLEPIKEGQEPINQQPPVKEPSKDDFLNQLVEAEIIPNKEEWSNLNIAQIKYLLENKKEQSPIGPTEEGKETSEEGDDLSRRRRAEQELKSFKKTMKAKLSELAKDLD